MSSCWKDLITVKHFSGHVGRKKRHGRTVRHQNTEKRHYHTGWRCWMYNGWKTGPRTFSEATISCAVTLLFSNNGTMHCPKICFFSSPVIYIQFSNFLFLIKWIFRFYKSMKIKSKTELREIMVKTVFHDLIYCIIYIISFPSGTK